jgi:hypothetical protein
MMTGEVHDASPYQFVTLLKFFFHILDNFGFLTYSKLLPFQCHSHKVTSTKGNLINRVNVICTKRTSMSYFHMMQCVHEDWVEEMSVLHNG